MKLNKFKIFFILFITFTFIYFKPVNSVLANSVLDFNNDSEIGFDYEPEDDKENIRIKRKEQKRWAYRMVNGREQKRLWSITYGEWLTEWRWV